MGESERVFYSVLYFYPGSMQIHFHLCFTDVQHLCYLLIGSTLNVSQQHDGALHFGQAVHEPAYERKSFASLQ